MLISKIEIQNFKCIRDLSLELKPLTVIVGPNGSGKTSLLEAITLFAQSNGRRITGKAGGDIVDFGDENDMFYNMDTKNELSLGFEIDLDDNEVKEIIEDSAVQIETLKRIFDDLEKERTARNQEPSEELMNRASSADKILNILNRFNTGIEQRKMKYTYGISKKNERYYYHQCFSVGKFVIQGEFSKPTIELNTGVELEINNYDHFLPHLISFYTSWDNVRFEKLVEILKKRIGDINNSRKIFFISSNRGDFSWESKAVGATNVGFKGEHTIEIISKLFASRDFTKISDLEFFASLFGIPKVWAGWSKQPDILTSSYIDPVTKASPLKFPHLGYGSKQILPVLVQLVKNEAGTLTLIEEPEISMHPQYQIRLPFLLAHAVNKGQQLVVTTQSSYFALALGQAIQGEILNSESYGVPEERKIKLNRNDIAVYQMTRDEKGVKAELLDFGEDGFLKRGIPTFVEVEKELFRRIFR